jgi:hypothetical protein
LDGSAPELLAAPGTSEKALRKLRGGVQALLGDLRGFTALHASAVVIDGRAILMVGASGSGKSTTAAGICRTFGGRLLADDSALLEHSGTGIEVAPSERNHYLTREIAASLGVSESADDEGGESEKVEVPADLCAEQAYPLGLTVVLRFDDSLAAPKRSRLSGFEAVQRLLPNVIRFDTEDPRARKGELDRIAKIYEQSSVVELARAHGSAAVESLIVELARGGHREK